MTGQPVTLDASDSTDQGTITDYKWDLDNSGNFATDTGSDAESDDQLPDRRRRTRSACSLTDSQGLHEQHDDQRAWCSNRASATTRTPSSSTPGLIDYYKLGEPSGPTIADSKGTSNGTDHRRHVRPARRRRRRPDDAIGFNGSSDYGSVPLNLSSTSKLTIEFWLKWNQYANNDALAMEFTPNFNANAGGFLVDPNAGQFGGTFGIGIGSESNRNSVFFAASRARACGTTTQS